MNIARFQKFDVSLHIKIKSKTYHHGPNQRYKAFKPIYFIFHGNLVDVALGGNQNLQHI
jgi:hypothetical protein